MTGIIPALAGNTLQHAFARTEGADHPRSRGEYAAFNHLMHHQRGSSPLSRGIRAVRQAHQVRAGIIPALAGNTSRT